jgi:hypothetical protein
MVLIFGITSNRQVLNRKFYRLIKKMFTIRIRICVIFLLGLGLLAGSKTLASAPTGGQPFTVAELENGLQLQWTAPAARFAPQDGGPIAVTMAGYELTAQPGTPVVPMTAALVALPPGARPSLEILAIQESWQSLPGVLAINPEPGAVLRTDQGEVIGGGYQPVDQVIPFNPDPVEIEILGSMRGVTLARVVFYPIIPSENDLRVVEQIQVQINFNAPHTPQTEGDATQSDLLIAALQGQVVNPQQVQPAGRAPNLAADLTTPNAVSPVALIEVETAGITEITYTGLASAGFPVGSVNTNNLKLTHAGGEIALDWDGDGDAVFEAGERFLFYADPRVSRWTTADYYTFSEHTRAVDRMVSRSASPVGLGFGDPTATLLVEENSNYTPDCLCNSLPAGWDGDYWAGQKISRPVGADTRDFGFTLPSVNTIKAGSLQLWMIGYTNVRTSPDHRVAVTLNTHSTLSSGVEWDGKNRKDITLPVPTGGYVGGANTLTLSLPGITGVSVEGFWLDAFEVEYVIGADSMGNSAIFGGEATQHYYSIVLDHITAHRAYDISTPETPLILTGYVANSTVMSVGDLAGGGPYDYIVTNADGIQAPTDIRLKQTITAQPSGADYVIITHSDFSSALASLVALRTGQGLSVVVEDVQAVYDNYDEGRPTPDAIKAYLQAAYDNWTTRPTYVLLVGDGTSDPKKFLGNSQDTFIPPYLADVDPWTGETAADNRYVTLAGGDLIPDMLVGRLPVNTLVAAQAIINKIVAYENSPPNGSWTHTVAFIADDQDSAGNFPVDAEGLATTYTAASYDTDRVYHSDGTPASTTQTAIQTTWNGGAGLITYVGHASQHQWASESLIHYNDVTGLTNGGMLPVVLEMTCYSGSFHTPGLSSLDEQMLRFASGGAVAVWGPTGLGLASGHVNLAEGFMEKIFVDDQMELGAAILAGKVNLLATQPSYDDLVDTFTLFGDPAQVLQLSKMQKVYLPLVLR